VAPYKEVPFFLCCQICTVCEHAMKVEAKVFLQLKEREYAYMCDRFHSGILQIGGEERWLMVDADGGDYDGAGDDDGGDNMVVVVGTAMVVVVVIMMPKLM
jgi:hypothetical protein